MPLQRSLKKQISIMMRSIRAATRSRYITEFLQSHHKIVSHWHTLCQWQPSRNLSDMNNAFAQRDDFMGQYLRQGFASAAALLYVDSSGLCACLPKLMVSRRRGTSSFVSTYFFLTPSASNTVNLNLAANGLARTYYSDLFLHCLTFDQTLLRTDLLYSELCRALGSGGRNCRSVTMFSLEMGKGRRLLSMARCLVSRCRSLHAYL